MTLFQKQRNCLSNKATTICGHSAENLRQVSIRHGREGVATEIKVQSVPSAMCRLTTGHLIVQCRPSLFYQYRPCMSSIFCCSNLQQTLGRSNFAFTSLYSSFSDRQYSQCLFPSKCGLYCSSGFSIFTLYSSFNISNTPLS